MNSKLALFCEKLIEACWLALAITTPLFFHVYTSRPFFIDKIVLVSVITHFMLFAWLVMTIERLKVEELTASLTSWLKQPLVMPTLAIGFSYLISTLLSIFPQVSFFGTYSRIEGLYILLTYSVIFIIVAQQLRTSAQRHRLLMAIMLTSVPICIHAMAQLIRLDPGNFFAGIPTWSRPPAGFGNPIYLAAYLIFVIPLTFSQWIAAILHSRKFSSHEGILILIYSLLLLGQGVTLIITQSRGPWVGLMMAAFIIGLLSLSLLRKHQPKLEQLQPREVLIGIGAGPLLLAGLAMLGVMGGGIGYLARLSWQIWPHGAVTLETLFLMGGVFLLGFGGSVYWLRSVQIWRWAWVSWVSGSILATTLLAVLISGQIPLGPLNQLPYMERLTSINAESGTGKIRTLIWDTALELLTVDSPLPDDKLAMARPIVGYGVASLETVFQTVHSVELSQELKRQNDASKIDKVHNETLERVITTGLLGGIAFYSIIMAIFYYSLKWLGFVHGRFAERSLIISLIVGGLLAAGISVLIDSHGSRLTFIPLASLVGMLAGLILFLTIVTFREQSPPTHRSQSHPILLLALLGGLTSHFIELQFGFYTPTTHVYFWLWAGMLVSILTTDDSTTEIAINNDPKATAHSASLILLIISITLIAGYVLIEQRNLGYLSGVIMVTWTVGLALYGFKLSDFLRWGSPILSYLGLTLIPTIVYGFIHLTLFNRWVTGIAMSIPERAMAQFILFFGFCFGLIAVMLWRTAYSMDEAATALPRWQSQNWWIYLPLAIALPYLIWSGSLTFALADIYAYQASIYQEPAHRLMVYEQAHHFAPSETRYIYELARHHQALSQQHVADSSNQETIEALLAEAETINPYDPVILSLLGYHYQSTAQTEAGLKRFKRAANLKPNDNQFQEQLGTAYFRAGQYETAQQTLEAALEREPNCVTLWLWLGDNFLALNEIEAALQAHQQTLSTRGRCGSGMDKFGDRLDFRLNSYAALNSLNRLTDMMADRITADKADIWAMVGQAYLKYDQPEMALSYLDQVPDKENRSVTFQQTLAQTYLALKQYNNALTYYQRLSQADPTEPSYQVALMGIYQAKGNPSKVVEHAQILSALLPDDEDALSRLAQAYYDNQQWAEAIETADQLLQLKSTPAQAKQWQRLIGQAWLQQGELGLPNLAANIEPILTAFEAISQTEVFMAELQQAVTRYPNQLHGQQALGIAYSLTGQAQAAIDALEKAQELGDTSSRTFQVLLLSYFEANPNNDKSMAEYQAVYEQNPNDVQAHNILAYIYMAQNRHDLAIWHAKRFTELFPQSHLGWRNLALLYQQQEAWADFAIAAEQALRTAPENEKAQWEQFMTEQLDNQP